MRPFNIYHGMIITTEKKYIHNYLTHKTSWKYCFFYLVYLFIYFLARLGSIGAVHMLSSVAESRGYFSSCKSFSLRLPLLLWSTGFSSCGLWASERRLISCGTQAQLSCGMWNPPDSDPTTVSHTVR